MFGSIYVWVVFWILRFWTLHLKTKAGERELAWVGFKQTKTLEKSSISLQRKLPDDRAMMIKNYEIKLKKSN